MDNQKFEQFNIDTGLRMKTAREKAGIYQQRIAEELQCTPEHISRIESGKVRPTAYMVKVYSDLCGVGPGYLMGISEIEIPLPDDTPDDVKMLAMKQAVTIRDIVDYNLHPEEYETTENGPVRRTHNDK